MTRRVLFIGGTGVISAAVVREALAQGIELTVLNRGSGRRPLPPDVESLVADVHDPAAVRAALGSREFDSVVDWVAFTPEHVQADVDRFAGRTGQYVFISSASAYLTPPARMPIAESTPLKNPAWPYSRDKIACEDLLMREFRDRDFPVTVVRPSHTYDETCVPFDAGWTFVERMRAGKEVIVHGDGSSMWTLTHSRDVARGVVPLLANPRTIGEAYTVTSHDAPSWDAIAHALARAAGTEARIVHVPSDQIAAAHPAWGEALLGDKTWNAIFDTSKLRSVVPDFVATTSFEEGAREIVAWHDADESRRAIDPVFDRLFDELADRFRVPAGRR